MRQNYECSIPEVEITLAVENITNCIFKDCGSVFTNSIEYKEHEQNAHGSKFEGTKCSSCGGSYIDSTKAKLCCVKIGGGNWK